MTKILTGSAALLLSASPLLAGGIERAPQSLAVLFEQGNYAELSFGGVDPTVEGTDKPVPGVYPGGLATGDAAQGYGFVGLAYKHQFNENLSGAFIVEQPFGADILYPTVSEGGSPMLGGTRATVDSTTFTALGRYRFANNFSIHGGLRGSKANGLVTLNGLAYGGPLPAGISGYEVKLDDEWGFGYVIGGAYEVPEIAARISLTYNSKIEHEFDTAEAIGGTPLGQSTTTVDTPESLTLEGQTGIAPDTLLFGSVRWVNWSEFLVSPRVFSRAPTADDPLGFGVSGGLVSLEDTTTYTIGVGRKFTENWSGSASFVYEPEGDDLVSPLAPTNGRKGITLAAIYTMDNMKITTGINYSKLGDASPQTRDTERARMEGSDLWGIGVRVGYSF